jgi:hypothetical protein
MAAGQMVGRALQSIEDDRILELTRALLALAAATTWDGGDALVSTLRGFLKETVPFDEGELALTIPTGYRRWTLTEDDEPLAAEDLLAEMCAREAPLRVDTLEEADRFPRTVTRLRQRGLASFLALPLGAAGGPEGAVLLARRFGWAFAGVPERPLAAAAAMAGICLERALALTAMRKELELRKP